MELWELAVLPSLCLGHLVWDWAVALDGTVAIAMWISSPKQRQPASLGQGSGWCQHVLDTGLVSRGQGEARPQPFAFRAVSLQWQPLYGCLA